MRYLCMGYHNEQEWSAMPADERDALIAESCEYEAELRRSGIVLQDGIALQGVRSAATLRFSGGQMRVTDGPFTETKEQLGGVMQIEAQDLNHAIQIMSQMPCMRGGGSMEIRPVNEAIFADTRRQSEQPVEIES